MTPTVQDVGANGLIVAFVVAVWAAYFVPLVLRRYDEASSAESLEDLSPLSRVVRRRASAAADHTDEIDADEAPETPVEAQEPVEEVAPTPAARPTRRAAIIAARRRRRTLITLLTLLAVVGGLAVFSVVAPVWVAAPAALVVAWLVACRVQVRGERGIGTPGALRARVGRGLGSVKIPRPVRPAAETTDDHEAARFPRRRRETSADEEPTVVVSGQVEDVDPGRRHVMERADLAVDALDEQLQIAVPSVSTQGTALWDPLPVTLPTYVTKPRVGRTVRTIDFDAPGAWTSGHLEGEGVELPGATAKQSPADESPSRRAVGE